MNLKFFFYFLFIVFVGFLSVWSLDGDPSILKLVNDLVDEGAWAHNAKSKVLFGSYFVGWDDCCYAYIGAPLYTFLLTFWFKVLGTSLFVNRLFTVVLFWGVLGTGFWVFKKSGHSNFKSLLPVLVLGVNHGALIFARWATPIFMEILILDLSFFLMLLATYENEDTSKNLKLMLGSGALLGLSLSAKLSACCQFPAFIVMAAFLVYPLRLLRWSSFLGFIGGIPLGLLPISVFYLTNLKIAELAVRALNHPVAEAGKILLIQDINTVIFNPVFKSFLVWSMVLCVFAFYFIRLVYCVMGHDKKIIFDFKRIDRVETMSFLWLFCGLFSYFFINERFYYRRYVVFLIPIVTIFSKFILFFWDYKKIISDKNNDRKVEKIKKFLISIIFCILFSKVVLIPVASYCSSFLDHYKIALWFFYLFLFCFSILFYFLPIIRRIAVTLVLSVVLFFNLKMNYVWLAHPTFSVRDESIRLKSFIPFGSLVTGFWPWLFLSETGAQVMWHSRFGNLNAVNQNFLKDVVKKGVSVFYVIEPLSNGKPMVVRPSDYEFLISADFKDFKADVLTDIHLMPITGSSSFRAEGRLVRMSRR